MLWDGEIVIIAFSFYFVRTRKSKRDEIFRFCGSGLNTALIFLWFENHFIPFVCSNVLIK